MGGKKAVVFFSWIDLVMRLQRCIITNANAKKSAVTQRQQPDLRETTLYINWIKLELTNLCHCLSLLCKPINPHFCKDTVP